MGSISSLIKDPRDIIPYMPILIDGLKSSLSDPLSEVRCYAAKAIGKISEKIGKNNTEKFFIFIKELLESQLSTAIERGGAC